MTTAAPRLLSESRTRSRDAANAERTGRVIGTRSYHFMIFWAA